MTPRRRVRRSLADIEQIVAQYRASGLSQAAFCRDRGLSPATLAHYVKRYAAPASDSSTPAFVAVHLAPAPSARPSGLTLALTRERRLEIDCGFDAATLAHLLTVLER
jgi:hypothetical protein